MVLWLIDAEYVMPSLQVKSIHRHKASIDKFELVMIPLSKTPNVLVYTPG